MDNECESGDEWRGKEYSFYTHRKCELFPCHDVKNTDDFNCLFCYCPLYMLGSECGGAFEILPNGVKDCTNCSLPHKRESFGYITGRFRDVVRKMKMI